MKSSALPNDQHIEAACQVLRKGGLIAYPTETVMGLGCDPFNPQAVKRLLTLKQRTWEKGLIMVALNWQQVSDFVDSAIKSELDHQLQHTQEPTTWLLPLKKALHPYITGTHHCAAIRFSQHTVVKTLCQTFGGPIISTSANISHNEPLRSLNDIKTTFGQQIDYYVPGPTGNKNPSIIKDIQTGKILRDCP